MSFVPAFQDLPTHRKTREAARALEMSVHDLWPRVIELSWFALRSRQDGDVSDLATDSDLLSQIWPSVKPENVQKLFQTFVKTNFIDKKNEKYFIHNWNKKGAGRLFVERAKARKRMKNKRTALRECSANIPRTLRECSALHNITGQDITGQNTEPPNPLSGEPASPGCPHREIQEIYHAVASKFPRIREFGEKRRRAMATAWKRHPDLGYWRSVFETANTSAGMIGQQWANFDFCIRRDVEILEGKYAQKFDSTPQSKRNDGMLFDSEEKF